MIQQVNWGRILTIILLLGGAFGGGYWIYTKIKASREEKQSREIDEKAGVSGTAEYFAKQLWLAGPQDKWVFREMYGNDELTLKIACQIAKSKVTFQEITEAFTKLTKGEYRLQEYIQDYLSESEFSTFKKRAIDKTQFC